MQNGPYAQRRSVSVRQRTYEEPTGSIDGEFTMCSRRFGGQKNQCDNSGSQRDADRWHGITPASVRYRTYKTGKQIDDAGLHPGARFGHVAAWRVTMSFVCRKLYYPMSQHGEQPLQ